MVDDWIPEAMEPSTGSIREQRSAMEVERHRGAVATVLASLENA